MPVVPSSNHALELMRKGDYVSALEMYQSLKKLTNSGAWDWQIRALERDLNLERSVFFNLEFGQVLRDIAGIQHIYVANLAHKVDRKRRMTAELGKVGIRLGDVSFVDAVHGATDVRALQIYEHFQVANPEHYESTGSLPATVFDHDRAHSSPSIIGYLLTQEKILLDAISNQYKRILVLDDDVFFSAQAAMLASKFFRQINDWWVVHLGASEHSPPDDAELMSKLEQAGRCGFYNSIPYVTCGSFAVAYDSAVFGKLLDLVREYVGVFDRAILSYFYKTYPTQCFALRPAACAADVSESDIREARNMNEHASRMGWDISRYDEYMAS